MDKIMKEKADQLKKDKAEPKSEMKKQLHQLSHIHLGGPCVLDDSLVNNPKIINKVDTTLKLGVMDQETRTIVSKTFGQLLSFFENKYKNNEVKIV